MIKLTVLRLLIRNSQRLKVGEIFEVETEQEAQTLIDAGLAAKLETKPILTKATTLNKGEA